MKHELQKLNYKLEELSPFLSRETLDYHYGRHHQTYIENLNKLISGTEFENFELLEIVKKSINGPIFNNAAQVVNHNFYFEQFSPISEHIPNVYLYDKLDEKWGNLEIFKEEFNKLALSNFGSGWTWLAVDKITGEFQIINTPNAQTIITDEKFVPLIVCDVWEHAYYIDYRNNRAKYLDNFWKIIDWKIIEERFKKAF